MTGHLLYVFPFLQLIKAIARKFSYYARETYLWPQEGQQGFGFHNVALLDSHPRMAAASMLYFVISWIIILCCCATWETPPLILFLVASTPW